MEAPVEALEVPAEPAPEPKKRGRPKKQVAEEGSHSCEVPGDAPMPAREGEKEVKSAPSPSQAFKIDAEVIGFGVSAIFGVIATASRHDHWLRTPEQCKPISE